MKERWERGRQTSDRRTVMIIRQLAHRTWMTC